MRTRTQLALTLLKVSRSQLVDNLKGVSVGEALQDAGGYRSILGILKHTAGWSHVYHSYAFDASPRHLNNLDWPRGLRDTIETSNAYFDEVVAWFESSVELWNASLAGLIDEDLDEPRFSHWGEMLPLFDIVVMVASHWIYHAGGD
jgi:DinB superfamily